MWKEKIKVSKKLHKIFKNYSKIEQKDKNMSKYILTPIVKILKMTPSVKPDPCPYQHANMTFYV